MHLCFFEINRRPTNDFKGLGALAQVAESRVWHVVTRFNLPFFVFRRILLICRTNPHDVLKEHWHQIIAIERTGDLSTARIQVIRFVRNHR